MGIAAVASLPRNDGEIGRKEVAGNRPLRNDGEIGRKKVAGNRPLRNEGEIGRKEIAGNRQLRNEGRIGQEKLQLTGFSAMTACVGARKGATNCFIAASLRKRDTRPKFHTRVTLFCCKHIPLNSRIGGRILYRTLFRRYAAFPNTYTQIPT